MKGDKSSIRRRVRGLRPLFLLLLPLVGSPVYAAAPYGQWWDPVAGPPYEYLNRKKITVNTGSAVAVGHTVSFTLDTANLISTSQLRADGNDWRVVWWNSGGSSWVELDRHVQFGTWNTATTKTWFKVQAAIPAASSDDNYYVYFNYAAEAGAPPATLWNVYNPPRDANTEVLWYGKDGTGATLTDSGPNVRNRALPAGWGWSSSSKFGTGFTMPKEDPSTKRIGSGFTPNVDTQDWTVEMWLHITDNLFVGSNDAMFWHTFRWGGFTQGVFWATDTTMYAEINAGPCRCDTTIIFSTFLTYHLAVTYEASTDLLRFYQNGVLTGTSPARIATAAAQMQYGSDGALDITLGATQEGLRVSNVRRTSFPYVVAIEPTTILSSTTEVDLVSFVARGRDRGVELVWETGAELNNLGFHLYRSDSDQGPFQRITKAAIPGAGSTPVGARYQYVDSGLVNGRTYYYKLEDIETTGKTSLHGPISGTPQAGLTTGEAKAKGGVAYGQPSASFRVVRQDEREMIVELRTDGYIAYPQPDDSVRFEVPGLINEPVPDAPDIPVWRSWLNVPGGRTTSIAWAREEDVQRLESAPPRTTGETEIVASRDGAVRLRQRPGGRSAYSRAGLYPALSARILEQGYQGETKKALVALSPLRWDARRGELRFARKLTVRLLFSGRTVSDRHSERTSHSPRQVAWRLGTREKGLYGVRFEDLGSGRRPAMPIESLRLSRLGQPLAFHIEPHRSTFGPGSTIYFWSEGASLNPYGQEAIYELERGKPLMMPVGDVPPSGAPVPYYWHRLEQEVNLFYQAGLLDAPDLWLWDLLFAPARKSYPFEVSALASTSEASSLEVSVQGVSDFPENPDHHLRVYVNGQLLAEKSWDGKKAQKLLIEVPPGILHEGANGLDLENVGDTGAPYSMVMLDKYALRYPRAPEAMLEGTFGRSGTVEVASARETARLLDLTGNDPRWLTGARASTSGLRFRVEEGRSYAVVSDETVLRPRIEQPMASRLKSSVNRADYLVIAPKAFLEAAQPLLELRGRQGLVGRAVAIEEIYSEFAFGEPRPDALRDFLAYAYHHWQGPKLRYVLLLGDATYDFRDYLGTGVKNQVPPWLVKTSYLWTASDPAYAAVNGEDLLPDLAIGRLPAASAAEARIMVQKILNYEAGGLAGGPVVLIADNPDEAGDFPAHAEELASTILATRDPEKIYLDRLGVEGTREAIVQAFDRGASLVSYVGHGGIHLWANENIFNTSQVEALAPQARQPVLLTFNCLNGYFHFPYFNSLAEELLKADGKGAIAAFSPSGLSLDEPAHRFHQALLTEVLSGRHQRLGDAVLAAQEDYGATGAFPELLQIYHLLGDPALRLR